MDRVNQNGSGTHKEGRAKTGARGKFSMPSIELHHKFAPKGQHSSLSAFDFQTRDIEGRANHQFMLGKSRSTFESALTVENLELGLEARVGQDGGVVVDGVDGETDGAQRLRELDVRQEGEPEGEVERV